MRQTLAIFLDAYRELNSRKLFWIVLAISIAVVGALAIPSHDERGIVVFGQSAEMPMLSTRAVSTVAFYKFLLQWFGINLWLAWGATILALISTAGMIPEMVSGGSIELVLSKPVSRLRLFLTKYFAGLMFVALQAAVFAVGAVLLIGLRAGVWDLRPFMAVPLIVLFFSYLFCVCALVGMLTRSTLLALLATILLWLATWAVATVENFMLDQRLRHEREVARLQSQSETMRTTLDALDRQIADLRGAARSDSAPEPTDSTEPEPGDAAAPAAPAEQAAGTPDQPPPPSRRPPSRRGNRSILDAGRQLLGQIDAGGGLESLERNRAAVARQVEQLESQLGPATERAAGSTKWHRRVYVVAAVLPKTGETKQLFQRYVIDKRDIEGLLRVLMDVTGDQDAGAAESAIGNRSLWWVIGTSLAFEVVILGIASGVFVRRDF